MRKSNNTIGIVIMKNQNYVTKSEIEKIRRAVTAEFPGRRTKVFANDHIDYMLSKVPSSYERIVYRTYDVNYEVWAEVHPYLSELHPDKEIVALN